MIINAKNKRRINKWAYKRISGRIRGCGKNANPKTPIFLYKRGKTIESKG